MGTSKDLSLRKIDASKYMTMFLGMTGLGFVLAAIGYFGEHSSFWQAYLINYFLFACFAIGGLFFVATQYVTKARWSVSMRRIPESFASFLPLAAIFGVIFLLTGLYHPADGSHFGLTYIYHWLDPAAVAKDELLQHKAGYLNYGFFAVRTIVTFALLIYFYKRLVGNSLNQDKDGDTKWTHSSITNSAIFLVIFAITFSMFSYDFLMSVEAHWFSTMFPVYTFATMFYSTMALMAWIAHSLMTKGSFGGYVTDEHVHDVSKLAFAFCVFYAYIAFCQFMLIWYAGIPEETFFYTKRWVGAWKAIAIAMIVFKFFFVFLLMMSRHMKRNPMILKVCCTIAILFALIDHLWIVYPGVHGGAFHFGFAEIGFFLFFGGLFGFTVSRFLSRNFLVPVKDPHIEECVHHHIFP